MNKLTLLDIDVRGKRVLVRVDLNVVLSESGDRVVDDFRIRAAQQTIDYLRDQGAKVILCSHLGRPKGRVVEGLRMKVVAERLSEILGCEVPVAPDCVGPEVEDAVGRLADGELLLLENLRFHVEEEQNEPNFGSLLARLGDVYVNDAFATAHRVHASIVTVPQLMSVAVAGFLMVREIESLGRLVADVERPYGAIFGGGKVKDKIGIMHHFLSKADVLAVGGAMANTFLKASGKYVGTSLVEDDWVDSACRILKEVKRQRSWFLLPGDVVVADRLDGKAHRQTVGVDEVPQGWCILDVGPRTVENFACELKRCKTIIWNGPLGKFERPEFAQGSLQMAEALRKINAFRVAGGGDTSALYRSTDTVACCDHVSTGGGSFLQFLEGRELPGIAALTDK